MSLIFNFRLPSQNGIRVKLYHFWPKNDDEKWSRKNIFEIPPWACRNLKNIFYIIERRIFNEIINKLMKMTWKDFKKNLFGGCIYDK